MNCPNCQAEAPSGAAFCMRCGHRLPATCAQCGAELPPGAAFCPRCGHPVAAAAGPTLAAGQPAAQANDDRLRRYIPPELLVKLESAHDRELQGERRRVTMLFCDVKGSTSAAEQLDPEEWAEIMNGAFEHIIAPVYRYEGTLARLMGDAVLAFFGAPIAHEDDAERAALAGLEILREIAPYREEVRGRWGFDFDVRVGVNTGLVVVGAVGSDLRVEYTAMGDAVNVAARMEQTAAPGTVQVSAATHALIRHLFEFEDLGPVEVKGRLEPVRSFRVLRAVPGPVTVRGIEGLRAPLIGRDGPLAELREAARRVQQGQGAIVSVIGEAGLGKSRLVAELRHELEGSDDGERVRWLETRNLSYESGIAFASVRRLVRTLAALDGDEQAGEAWPSVQALAGSVLGDREAEVGPMLGALLELDLPSEAAQRVQYLEPPQLRAGIVSAVVELVEALSSRDPVTMVFEDLHWADSASIEVVLELQRVADRAMLMLLQIFRPNRQDAAWRLHEVAERDHPHLYRPITLAPLAEDETRTLVSSLLAIDGLPDAVRDLILRKAEGNPYFVEEVIRSLIDQQLVHHEEERWVATGAVADVAIPDTLAAVLTTRLDQLDERARSLMQAASVIGREFYLDELVAVVDDPSAVDDTLVELQRRELLREVARLPRRQFRFKHALVQDAAYETILLRRRAGLHAGVAALLEREQPDRIEDIARHYLGARQPERALPYLVAAGERACHAFSIPEALAALEQALGLMDDRTDPGLLRRALEALGEARQLSYDIEGARTAYERLRDDGERLGDLEMRLSGQNKLAFLRGFMLGERDEALEDLAHAEAMGRDARAREGLVESCMVQCYLRTTSAEFDLVEHYMREVERLGAEFGMSEQTLFGMTHFANALTYLARFDEALHHARRALDRAEALGHLKFQAELLTFALPVCFFSRGDFPAGIEALQRGHEIALRIGDREAELYAAMFLGKIAMAQGAYEEALARCARASAAADAVGLPYLQALALSATGTCYLQVGLLERAVDLHREVLERMEMPTGHIAGASAWSEVGFTLLAAGDLAGARALFERAVNEASPSMHLMRPVALQGLCAVALAAGETAEAQRWSDALDTYVRERSMHDQLPAVLLTAAGVLSASGDHEAALERLEQAEAMVAPAGMQRPHLELLAHRARCLDGLDRGSEASQARAAGRRIVEDIASGLSDEQARSAFVAMAVGLLDGGR